MAATYKIVWSEDGSTSLVSGEELHKEYGGATKPKEFIDALLSTPILRSTLLMESVEKLSAETLFTEAESAVAEKQAELAKAKAVLDDALIEVLKEITDKEVDKGEHHKLSTADNAASYSTVEVWLRKAKPNLDKLLEEHKSTLPTHVGMDLERIRGKRKSAAANRIKK